MCGESVQPLQAVLRIANYRATPLYSIYASLCGCISIVVPEEGVTKEEWHPKIEDRYGLAYGFDDIEYAKDTKHKMIRYVNEQQELNLKSVKYFAESCKKYFSIGI